MMKIEWLREDKNVTLGDSSLKKDRNSTSRARSVENALTTEKSGKDGWLFGDEVGSKFVNKRKKQILLDLINSDRRPFILFKANDRSITGLFYIQLLFHAKRYLQMESPNHSDTNSLPAVALVLHSHLLHESSVGCIIVANRSG
ncbi:hypothetical protein BDA99DRAFT_574227 [Phascolomyces articulosus]|uniref:Uncharacterized protein n=1 Tax=Phascolomyces articulosus TaxID=60185 RepID=A0AAD5PB35_9FUNG|nr:hypothetical protein BDA99DRAFT_574227 [Phascolomyces articulosus]